jgi:hypothetical protein
MPVWLLLIISVGVANYSPGTCRVGVVIPNLELIKRKSLSLALLAAVFVFSGCSLKQAFLIPKKLKLVTPYWKIRSRKAPNSGSTELMITEMIEHPKPACKQHNFSVKLLYN